MTIEEMRKLNKGDKVLISKSAWDNEIFQPNKNVPCTVTYLNGTTHDAIQVHVFPLDTKSKYKPKYVFPKDIISTLP